MTFLSWTIKPSCVVFWMLNICTCVLIKSLISLYKEIILSWDIHCVLSEENVLRKGRGFICWSSWAMCCVYFLGGQIFCHNEYLFMSSSKSRAAFCSKNNQTDDLNCISLCSIQYMRLDSLVWSETNKHIHGIFYRDIIPRFKSSEVITQYQHCPLSWKRFMLCRQLIIYRDKSSLLLRSCSRRLPGVFPWLLGDCWLQDLLESAAEATRPPRSADVGMLAGWACPTRQSSRLDWSAARLPAWAGLVRRVSRDGKQSSLHSNTAPRSVQSVWRRRHLENKNYFRYPKLFYLIGMLNAPVAVYPPSKHKNLRSPMTPYSICMYKENGDSSAVTKVNSKSWK